MYVLIGNYSVLTNNFLAVILFLTDAWKHMKHKWFFKNRSEIILNCNTLNFFKKYTGGVKHIWFYCFVCWKRSWLTNNLQLVNNIEILVSKSLTDKLSIYHRVFVWYTNSFVNVVCYSEPICDCPISVLLSAYTIKYCPSISNLN